MWRIYIGQSRAERDNYYYCYDLGLTGRGGRIRTRQFDLLRWTLHHKMIILPAQAGPDQTGNELHFLPVNSDDALREFSTFLAQAGNFL